MSTDTRRRRHETVSDILQQNAAGLCYKPTVSRMSGVGHRVVLLSVVLLLVSPCVPVRAERGHPLDLHQRDVEGADVEQVPAENQETPVKHEQKDGVDSIVPQEDGHSVRSDTANTYSTVKLVS